MARSVRLPAVVLIVGLFSKKDAIPVCIQVRWSTQSGSSRSLL